MLYYPGVDILSSKCGHPGVEICPELPDPPLTCHWNCCRGLSRQSHLSLLPWQGRSFQVKWWQSKRPFCTYMCLFLLQEQLLKLQHACKVSWHGISGTSLVSNASFSKHCILFICPRCARPLWVHLQVSAETRNNNTWLVSNISKTSLKEKTLYFLHKV